MMAIVAVCVSVRAAAQDTTAVSTDTIAVSVDTIAVSTDTIPYLTDTVVAVDSARVAIPAAPANPGDVECGGVPETRFHASPLLPEDHWAVRAAWRAEALGLTRFLPAQRAVPRAEVARALFEAQANAGTPALQDLAEGWMVRFVEEFPEYAGPGRTRGGVTLLGGEAAVGYDRWTGRITPAIGFLSIRQDPRPLPDVSDGRASLLGGVAIPNASASAEGAWRGGEAVLRQWDVAVGAGAFQLSVGRAPVGYGWGRTGGLVYADPDPLPRVELRTTRPFRLPGFLRHVGPVTLQTFAGPVNDDARHPTGPNLWGMRAAFQPHPRLTFGANRGAIFGGEDDPITVSNLAKMVLGVIRSRFENQVISVDARWRLPTDRVLPATAYIEWGADDAAGALDETPARVIGLFLPILPGAPQAALGVEYTYFKAACCGHGAWYVNSTFPGNWAVRDRPLGHPLGGEGAEYAAYAQADLLDARLRMEGRAWIADRSDHSLQSPRFGAGNLFTPQRTGRSTGGRLDTALRIFPRAELRAGWTLEDGDGWREQSLRATFAWLF